MTADVPRDVHALSPSAIDALREVANIGAGHAATALSQITEQRIMISVPRLNVAAIEEIPNQVAGREEPVAAVLMKITGDLNGYTLLIFPLPVALRVAGFMMRKRVAELGVLESSALKEAGNILSAAYLNALAEFLHMRILNSPPELAIDLSEAVLSSAYLQVSTGGAYVFCVESEFQLQRESEPLRGFFLLLPDGASLRRILDAVRVA